MYKLYKNTKWSWETAQRCKSVLHFKGSDIKYEHGMRFDFRA